MAPHIKRISAFFISILFCMNAFATDQDSTTYCQKGYHPETPGLTMTYACLDKEGKIDGYYTMKLIQVEEEENQRIFHYFQQFYRADATPILKETGLPLKVTVDPDAPTYSQLKGWTRAIKTMDMVAKGDVNTLPDSLYLHTSLPESEIKIKLDNIGASLYTINRRVKDHQNISLMAGEFDSFYLTETQEMHAVITIEENLETWYARGIGAIRQRILNKKGQLVRGMELIDVRITEEGEITDISLIKDEAEQFLSEL